MNEALRLIPGAVLILSGLLTILAAMIGIFKFDFVLNRMHCAALCDTLGLLLILAGLFLISGRISLLPKFFLILLFQWIGSPIASHMVSRLEAETDPSLERHIVGSIREKRKDREDSAE